MSHPSIHGERAELFRDAKFPCFSPYVQYSVVFAILAVCCFLPFPLLQKRLTRGDGITQHMTALAYWGSYLRTWIASGFRVHPQWDFSLGLGSDILTTLHYYAIGDPLNLLSVFVPEAYTEHLYYFLIFLRLYLAGLCFIAFCLSHKFHFQGAVAGAVVYLFCGYTLMCAPRHPFFLNPFIHLPLLCMGVDRILDERKPVLLAVVVALAGSTSFYFLYMETFFLGLYVLLRYGEALFSRRFPHPLNSVLLLLVAYLTGLCLASWVFVPNVAMFFTTERSTETITYNWHYPLLYYVKLPLAFASPIWLYAYTFLGFSAPTLIAELFLFHIHTIESKVLKWALCFLLLFLVFPFFGHMLNGFNYVTNRWLFAGAFTMGLVTAYSLPRMVVASRKELLIPIFFWIAFSILVLGASMFSATLRSHCASSFAVLLVTAIGLLFIHQSDNRKIWLGAMLCVSTILNAWVFYSPWGINYLDGFVNFKTTFSSTIIHPNHASAPSGFARLETWRPYATEEMTKSEYERNQYVPNVNASAVNRTHETSYYWSIVNGLLVKAHDSLGLSTASSLKLCGLNGRSSLMALYGVSSYYAPSDSPDPLPYGYTMAGDDGELIVYQSDNTLPLAFGYTHRIDPNVFAMLSPVEKQEALLQGVVTDKQIAIPILQPIIPIQDVPFSIVSYDEGVEPLTNGIKVTTKQSGFTIRLTQTTYNSELYLLLPGLIGPGEKTDMYISCGQSVHNYEITGREMEQGHNPAICLGYKDYPAGTEIHLTFSSKGTYSWKKVQLQALDPTSHDWAIQDLQNRTLTDLDVRSDRITGTYHAQTETVLCLTIPYTTGWHAFVDGKSVSTFPVQGCFTGISVESGTHTIRLIYRTPFLVLGCMLTVIGLCILLFLIWQMKKRS